MRERSKRYRAAAALVDREKRYDLTEAVALLKKMATTKLDQSVEVALRLAIDPKKSDQAIRGSVSLPKGIGQERRVICFADGADADAARESGADEVGMDELAKKIEGGWLDFDAVVSTPDMMKVVGKLGRILGPRGLMPNPKSGTVTFDLAQAIDEIKGGKVEFRVDKAANLHAPVGKASFEAEQLRENANALINAVLRLRPAAAKGRYIRSLSVSTTMGPGIKVDESNMTVVERL